MGNEVTFTLQVTMNDRWMPYFCSMLKCMEDFGKLGHSGLIGFYADGDGDFHPKFKIDCDYDVQKGIPRKELHSNFIPEVLFDAG